MLWFDIIIYWPSVDLKSIKQSCQRERVQARYPFWIWNPRGRTHEVQNRSYQWLHKMDLGPDKKFKKKKKDVREENANPRHLPPTDFHLMFYCLTSEQLHFFRCAEHFANPFGTKWVLFTIIGAFSLLLMKCSRVWQLKINHPKILV